MEKIIFSPSILSADFSRMAEELIDIKAAGAKWVHLDVMDGIFVPNITFGPPIIKALRKESDLFFDAHLMIHQPERYIENFANAGADLITIHVEATENILETINQIKSFGCKVGLAYNPETEIDGIESFLAHVDMVLLMSVHPGFGGQSFIDISDKLKKLYQLKQELAPNLLIQVDGGINLETIAIVTRNGANVIVAGSAILGKPDRKKAMDDLSEHICSVEV